MKEITVQHDVDPELLTNFLDESEESIATLDSLFVELEQQPKDEEIIGSIFRVAHSIKGLAAFLGFDSIKELTHELETVLANIRDDKLCVNSKIIDCLLAGFDNVSNMLTRVRVGKSQVEDENRLQELLNKIKQLSDSSIDGEERDVLAAIDDVASSVEQISEQVEELDVVQDEFLKDMLEAEKAMANNISVAAKGHTSRVSDKNIDEEKRDASTVLNDVTGSVKQVIEQVKDLNVLQDKSLNEKVEVEKDKVKNIAVAANGRTMRVSEENIDVFMHYVGDLIEMSESFNLLQKRVDINSESQLAREFKDINSGFNQLSNKLQKSLLAIRKVPAKSLIQKVPRMVRDLAHSLDKEVKVEVTGQDVQIDKSMIEALESPINHLVRNCVDHGIETPEERKRAGKSEIGMVKIDITEHGEDIVIKIKDDGAGIDPKKIREKALQMGLVTDVQAAQLNDRDALQFIFSSGFSTAKKVSDVSGRGVGMDVVRNNVESLKGSIDLQSTLGQGSTIILRMPSSLTVLVANGMLVGLGDQQYIVKVEDIHEAVRPKPEEIITVQGYAECFHVHGQIYPLIRLHELFGVETEFTNPAEAMVILAEGKDCRAAILVDRILGQQRVVVKELDRRFSNLEIVAGTAILANTRVGLVLDIPGILAKSQEVGVIE